ncbi:glycosyltransferase family protein [Isoptericola jiangsuensis]|uniref:glycosyltransferase family protein n=1 Tax=Isoptericola jiangsuensis TaxID=548579 RepID=UPI003AAA4405
MRRRKALGVGELMGQARRTRRGLTYEPWPNPARGPRRALRVGVILDDFSLLALEYEWEQVILRPSTWREQLDTLDLVFVESAWKGNGGAWQFQLTGPSSPSDELVALLHAARERGVPSVFWNKEDPVHLEEFRQTASLFDRVYTTDADCLDRYRTFLGHDRVGVLRFAAQPAIHNPVRLHGRGPGRDVAFAGTWFARKYPERRAHADIVLGGALDACRTMPHGLEIFSRFSGKGDQYEFPEPYSEYVVGSLDYRQMLTAYRDYRVFLNVNAVIDSSSMCSRRIVEITACGTPVVTSPSRATSTYFSPDEVFTVTSRAEAADMVSALVRSPELRDHAVHLGQRRIWREHTYAARVQKVLHDVGLAGSPDVARPSVSALVSTNRPHRIADILATVGAQRRAEAQLVLLTHGFVVDDETDLRLRAKRAGVEDLVLLTADVDVPLGRCLNRIVRAAEGDVVAKMDDDDLYGPNYLSDQLDALQYSGADVVGKQAHYLHLEAHDVTLLRHGDREHRFTDFVMGPTIVTRREIAADVEFGETSSGEDTAFLRRAAAHGLRTYAADRFNFVQVRSGGDQHTWAVSDVELLARGQVAFFGPAEQHVIF